MKKIILIILIIILSLISFSCAVQNDVCYQKNDPEHFYLNNSDFMKYHYHYHVSIKDE